MYFLLVWGGGIGLIKSAMLRFRSDDTESNVQIYRFKILVLSQENIRESNSWDRRSKHDKRRRHCYALQQPKGKKDMK